MAIAEDTISKVKQKIYGDPRILERIKAAKSLDDVTEQVHKVAADMQISLDKAELRAIFADAPATDARGKLSDEDLEAVAGGKGGGGGGGSKCSYCLGTKGTYCIGTR